MSTTVQVYAGAAAPEKLTVTWQRRDETFDTETVVSAELHALKGAVVTVWACSIVSKTADQVVVKHDFAESELEPGRLLVAPILRTSGGGQRRGEPFNLTVLEYPH